jgi:hypothetical protein
VGGPDSIAELADGRQFPFWEQTPISEIWKRQLPNPDFKLRPAIPIRKRAPKKLKEIGD